MAEDSSKAMNTDRIGKGADPLASYRKRVKRAFRNRSAADTKDPTGTAIANPGTTEDEGAQARRSGSQTEGEN